MCMPFPPAAEMIFGLMVLNSDLLDGRMIYPQGVGRLLAGGGFNQTTFSRKKATQLFASWAA